ncbi:YdcF family protein [Mucilaginibacter sp. KACC 22773]|uniref:YdcF family protein n=1 Tax=Mucilaginibacter sp. KACC 22773 TaxID=3025671 RepID=UPI00236577A2|nr:YdcF family protein [Mucilaginibacter sp. KACC 22773]WDF76139.1 YdcF family protein [Mucilaginibacter sp. KACC 22773]
MKKFIVLSLLCLSWLSNYAQVPLAAGIKRASTDYVEVKNYYLLSLFEQDNQVSLLLKNDAQLAQLAQQKLSRLNTSLTDCGDASCLTAAVKLTDDEIRLVTERLTALYKPGNALDKLVKTKLIPSGAYSLYKKLPNVELLQKAWEQDAGSVNYTIAVYAEGKKPNYPQIDSISYNVHAKAYRTLMYDVTATLIGDVKNTRLFFEPSMQAALLYLQINERQNPANYEPMEFGANKAAVNRIKSIKWAGYPYSNILVPGAGPDNLTSPLSGEGMLRCRLAVQQYKLGKAPFIIVSGGKVHPYKTKYNEAEEMKVYLVKTLHIPENAIIIEPHARHTTTNMRNSARLIYKYGIPANKPGIVVTDKSQTDFIMTMDARCQKELNYVPYKLAKRNSETEVEYYPVEDAKQIDPDEPLDPR